MFEQLIADYEERVREVDLYFQLLTTLDNDQLSIAQTSDTGEAVLESVPTDCGRMLKGTAYLVLYNLAEAFVRRGFQVVFDAIEADNLSAVDLSVELRKQWVEQRNRRVRHLDGSPKVYMDISHQLINDVIGKNVVKLRRDRLPIAGNVDADKIRELCRLHGVAETCGPDAKGGSSLATVKAKRNALSHGDESFVEVGRDVSVADLLKTRNEVVTFMRDVLGNLRDFAAQKTYQNTA